MICENIYLCGAARRLVPPGGLGYWVAGVLHDVGDAQRQCHVPPVPGTVSPTANMRERKLHPDAHNAPTSGQLPRFGSLCCGPKFQSLPCFWHLDYYRVYEYTCHYNVLAPLTRSRIQTKPHTASIPTSEISPLAINKSNSLPAKTDYF
jgi:hypothetical protein